MTFNFYSHFVIAVTKDSKCEDQLRKSNLTQRLHCQEHGSHGRKLQGDDEGLDLGKLPEIHICLKNCGMDELSLGFFCQ